MPGKHTIRKKKQLSWEAVGHSLRSRTAQCVYVILAGAVILCILFMAAITPQRYDLKVGDIITQVDGKDITMQVKEGQKVVYSKYAGTEIKIDGEEYKIVRQSDILAIVE